MSKNYFPDADIGLENLEPGLSRKIRAHGGGLMAVEVFFAKGAVGAEHRHPHEQVCYCLSGEFVFTIEGREPVRLTAGDTLYFESSVLHGAKCISEGRLLDVFTPQREDFLKA
jgi:quercetin dioxygenase-like cupin family protein